jgi:hypothetical protein
MQNNVAPIPPRLPDLRQRSKEMKPTYRELVYGYLCSGDHVFEYWIREK